MTISRLKVTIGAENLRQSLVAPPYPATTPQKHLVLAEKNAFHPHITPAEHPNTLIKAKTPAPRLS